MYHIHIEIVQNFLHKHMSIYLRLNKKKKIRDTTKEKRSLNFVCMIASHMFNKYTYIMLLQIKKNILFPNITEVLMFY